VNKLKSKEKTMKKKILLMIFLVFLQASCNDENAMPIEKPTEADVFVASEQHQKYQMILIKDRKRMNSIVNSMSKNQRKQYTTLLDSVVHTKTVEVQNELVTKLTKLTGVDYEARVVELMKARTMAFKGVRLDKQDYIKAIQHYNVRVYKKNITRNTFAEDVCAKNCESSYLCEIGTCKGIQIKGWDFTDEKDVEEYNDWCVYRECVMNADYNYEVCLSNCY